jgi:hypothetical protein
MVEFNSDGSIKLSSLDKEIKPTNCVIVKKEVLSFDAPKKCVLHLKIPGDNRFVTNIHQEFSENASVPSKLVKIDEHEFDIEIGTDFRRCSQCMNLIGRFKECQDIVVKKGNCTFEDREFHYESYFD